jgi:hypothetical protein
MSKWQSLVLTLLLAGCSERPRGAACVIVPSGFRGPIQIQGNVPSGSTPGVKGDCDVFRIPPSGVLQLRCPQPGETWRNWAAAFSDGAPLLEQSQLDSAEASGTLAKIAFNKQKDPVLWTLWADDTGSLWLYVGTEAEYKRVLAGRRMLLVPGQVVGPSGRNDRAH